MHTKKIIIALVSTFIMLCSVCMTAQAGTYNVVQTVSGNFTGPSVTVTNSAGRQYTGNSYRLSSSVTNVISLTQTIRLNTVGSGSGLSMNVFYSTNGTNFTIGTTVYCPVGTEVTFTMNVGSAKTIMALFYLPNTSTWPSYHYTVWSPQFTRQLTDNTAPSISLSQQSYYSRTSVTITASISDSESGVSLRKYAQGYQTLSYFTNSGTTFSGSYIYAYSNGTYSVYARDAAGNAAVQYINVTMLDTTPPSISAAVSPVYAPTNTVAVNISDSQSGVALRKWAYGNRAASYFASGGISFPGSAFTVSANGIYTIYARDNVGNESVYTITVSYVDNAISVTHPISVSYTLNPNSDIPFIADDVTLSNHGRTKVRVSVQSFAAAIGGGITFSDVGPGFFVNWNNLTAAQTKQYIALGVRVAETFTSPTGWYTINAVTPIYGAQITGLPVQFGILNPNNGQGSL